MQTFARFAQQKVKALRDNVLKHLLILRRKTIIYNFKP